MDLFTVERYMGEDEDEFHQQDESLRLTRLQRDIDNRKRKRQGDHNKVTHVFSPGFLPNSTEALDCKQLMSDVQEKGNKKAKKEKTKNSEDESKKNRAKRSSMKDSKLTSTREDNKSQNIQVSVDSDGLESEPEENRFTGNKEKKMEKEEYKADKKAKKRSSKEGLTAKDIEDENMVISVDSDSLKSNTRKKEKKLKSIEGKSEKKLKRRSSKEYLTTEDGVEENVEISIDSEMNKVKKKKERKREESVSNDKRENEKGDICREIQDIHDEQPDKEGKETGFTVIGGQKKEKEVKKVQRVLPDWLAKPTTINSDLGGTLCPVNEIPYLDSHIIDKLQQHDINHLFPVQSVVIPAILSQMETNSCFGRGGFQPSDVCISAPTGSGKTLAYVLPIIQSLLPRVVCHLRALVILPTKDLASQVKQVFEMFTEGTNLKVGLASGSKSFMKDQEQLVSHSSCGGSSRVDILICTPGRLVDHISSTLHFTLHHVRFLVIDEADRLLDQSYHGWLGKVLKAAYNKKFSTNSPINDNSSMRCNLQTIRNPPGQQTVASFATIQLPLQKLLFSATMTHSPEKLAPLQLYQPVLFTATGSVNQRDHEGVSSAGVSTSARYSIPESLSEYMTVCSNGEKPLAVLYFLTQLKFQRVLCFASSLEATHRLYLLVKLYGGVQVAEYSSSLTPQQRKAILRDFRLGKVELLICSDAMARGMDIQDVSYVISYDVPNYVRSYIHRVGRTARAGNKGTAITLLHSEEVHHFKELIQKSGREKIPKYIIKEGNLQSMVDKYQETLAQLQDAVKLEGQKKSQQKGKAQVVKLLQEQLLNNLLQKTKC